MPRNHYCCVVLWFKLCLTYVDCAVTVQRHIPLKVGLNEFRRYTAPRNLDYVGPTFMFLGFVPADLASIPSEQGIQVCSASSYNLLWWPSARLAYSSSMRCVCPQENWLYCKGRATYSLFMLWSCVSRSALVLQFTKDHADVYDCWNLNCCTTVRNENIVISDIIHAAWNLTNKELASDRLK